MILQRFYNTQWLCEPYWLEHGIQPIIRNKFEGNNLSLKEFRAIEKEEGRAVKDSKSRAFNRGSTRVIPIEGTIIKKANLFENFSNLTSTTSLALDFNTALEDDDVESIIFNIDSPGGEATGISEFAEMIYSARGTKPIVAYVSGSAQSAAYWIASACDKIVINDTAGVGSIGVAVFIEDDTKAKEDSGVKTLILKNDLSPNKLPDPTTNKGKDLIVERLNSLADVFFTKVALYRSSDEKSYTVKDVVNFKKGGTATGDEAVKIGLADQIGSFEQLIKELGENKMADKKTEAKAEANVATEEAVDTNSVVSLVEYENLKSEFESFVSASEKTAENQKATIEALAKDKEDLKKSQSEAEADRAAEFDKMKADVARANEQLLSSEIEKEVVDRSDKLNKEQVESFKSTYRKLKEVGDEETLSSFLTMVDSYSPEDSILSSEVLTNGVKVLSSSKDGDDNKWMAEIDESTDKFVEKLNSKKE